MTHDVHRPYLMFPQNSVRCKDFNCDWDEPATAALVKCLPVNSKVEFKKNEVAGQQPMIYVVTVNNIEWCKLIDLLGGFLYLDGFNGSDEEFKIFQLAVSSAFGIYEIQNGTAMVILSSVAP